MKNIIVDTTDDLKLSAIINETDTKDRIVIMCHGIRGTKDERGLFVDLSEKLEENNISSIRFDFRGHGESDGIDKEVTITKEIEDLETIIKYVTDLGYNEIFALGASFGGGIVSLVDYNKYPKVQGLVLLYPAVDFSVAKQGNLFTDENKQEAIKNGYYVSKSVSTGKEFRFGLEMFNEIDKYKPYEKLEKLNLPILFVHGTSDRVVPYELSVEVSKVCNNAKVELIDNGDHTFDNDKLAEQSAIEKITEFVDKIDKK